MIAYPAPPRQGRPGDSPYPGDMFDLRLTLVVGLGAAIGGMARLLVTQLVVSRAGAPYAPWATLFINVSGSFLIGLVIEVASTRAGFPPAWRSFLATGILGGYTTFSTFSLEAISLGVGSSALLSTGYVLGSVVLGIVAAFGGIVTARAVTP
jgi:CrcB protein